MSKASQTLLDLGPWPGGLHERAGDNCPPAYLSEAENIFVDDRGFIRPRPGVHVAYSDVSGASIWDPALTSGKNVHLLGSVYKPSTNTEHALLWAFDPLSTSIGTRGLWSTQNASDPTAYVKVMDNAGTDDNELFDLTVYGDKVYFVANGNTPGHAVGGFSIPVASVGSAVALSTVANVPLGHEIFAYQDRIFVINYLNNTMYWSKATDPTIWAPPDGGFLNVFSQDDDTILGAVVYNNLIYIFKRDSCYVFSYTDDPAIDGFLTVVNAHIGGEPFLWNDQLLLNANDGRMYRVSGTQLIDIAPQMMFSRSGTVTPYRPVEYAGLLAMGFKDNGINKFYIANIAANAWAKWTPSSIEQQAFTTGKSATSFNGTTTCRVIGYKGGFGEYLSYVKMPSTLDPEQYYLVDQTRDKGLVLPRHYFKTGYLGNKNPFRLNRYKKFKRGWLHAVWFHSPVADVGLQVQPASDSGESINANPVDDVYDGTGDQNTIQMLTVPMFRYRYLQFLVKTYAGDAGPSVDIPPSTFTGWSDSDRDVKAEYYFDKLMVNTDDNRSTVGVVDVAAQ